MKKAKITLIHNNNYFFTILFRYGNKEIFLNFYLIYSFSYCSFFFKIEFKNYTLLV